MTSPYKEPLTLLLLVLFLIHNQITIQLPAYFIYNKMDQF